MLLQELTGIKSQKGKTATSILDLLRNKYGIKLANGAFGVVLIHSSWDHVLKFFAKDDCYLNFVEYCRKNPNKHLPVFKKPPTKLSVFFKNSQGEDVTDEDNIEKLTKYYAVKIEKLDPLRPELYDICYNLANHRFLLAYQDVIGTSKAKDFLKNYEGKDLQTREPLKIDLSPYQDLADLIFNLDKNRAKIDGTCGVDLHSGNFMMRGETIVITDPYADPFSDSGVELSKIISDADMDKLTDRADIMKTADLMASEFTIPLVRDTKPLSS